MGVKNVINWSYERASWQWDLLCVVIMMFIFLTPKEWFNKPKTPATQTASVAVLSDDGGCDINQ